MLLPSERVPRTQTERAFFGRVVLTRRRGEEMVAIGSNSYCSVPGPGVVTTPAGPFCWCPGTTPGLSGAETQSLAVGVSSRVVKERRANGREEKQLACQRYTFGNPFVATPYLQGTSVSGPVDVSEPLPERRTALIQSVYH